MDNDHTRQEIVKCVVVGDTAVGKTRLICARACNAYLTLSQVLATHIPTVWAIDQYRIHKEVLRRSWKVVDGVNVSLRLWDTFGDHEKDRKYAYGRSDVVLLCFSVSNRLSLRNCKTKWYPEIRHYCPNTPIILVGCKNDLRHIYRDERFLELCREKSPFVKLLQESDLTSCDQGRIVANEIGAPYYEASVLTQYGVDEVFENAMRAALAARRQQRFWIKNLKNVQMPLLQMPYCPPKPSPPEVRIPESDFEKDMVNLLSRQNYTDVKLLVGKSEFFAHKVVLAAASTYFHQIFISSLVVCSNDGSDDNSEMVLTAFQWSSPVTMQNFLRFLYTGTLERKCHVNLSELLEIAQITSIEELQVYIKNIQYDEDYLNYKVQQKYLKKLQENMKNICLCTGLFTDIVLELDNGNCSAHRPVLMARSDVMAAMFGGDFRESSAKLVKFPGLTKECCFQLLVYLYTDSLDESINVTNCLPLLELANRLCLLHLVALVEKHIVHELSEISRKRVDITDHIFRLLEPCQMHNADQLSDWLQYFIAVNYKDICLKSSKSLRTLHPENQAYLNKNRWPPVYYLKEYDYYERCVRERELKERPPKFLRWRNASKKVNGCLWFWGKRNQDNNGQAKSSSCITSVS